MDLTLSFMALGYTTAECNRRESLSKQTQIQFLCILCVWIGDKALDGYSKKKYVCKLLFIFLLGHDIDFGHMEAVNLLSSNKYTEKQIVSISLISLRVLMSNIPVEPSDWTLWPVTGGAHSIFIIYFSSKFEENGQFFVR